MDITHEVGNYQFNSKNYMNEETERSSWFSSSIDPLKLSLTIRGALLMYVPFVLAIAQNFGLPLLENEVMSWVTSISFVAAASMIVWGVLRKLYVKFFK